MPSPATFNKTHPLSEYSDDIIQKYIVNFHEKGEGRNLAFATTADFLSDSEGFLLNKIYFSKDQIHLNENGARVLATEILKTATILAQITKEGES